MEVKKFIRFIAVLIIIIFINNATAEQINFKHLTVKDGLSHEYIKSIYRDSYGYMWFGTGNSGINKFDGHNFVVYKSNLEDKKTISNNTIIVIFEDKDRNLYVGTQRGLNFYNRDLDIFTPIPQFNETYINGIYELHDGRLAVVSLNELILFNPKNHSFNQIALNEKNITNDVTEDGFFKYQNKFWLATRSGLFSVDTTDFTFTPVNNIMKINLDLSVLDIRSVCIDNKNRLWLGTENEGLFNLQYSNGDPNKLAVQHLAHNPNDNTSISKSPILAIDADNNGSLLLALERGGLDILDLNKLDKGQIEFEHNSHDQSNNASISTNAATTVYKDIEGTIWVGTFDGSINYYNKILQKFGHVKYNQNNLNGLSNSSVSVLYDEGDRLWVGTGKGLNVYNRKTDTWHHYLNDENDPKSLGSDGVWAIFRDSRKNLWVGTWGGGLNLLNESTGKFTRFLHDEKNKNSISSNNMFGISEDSDGNLWIATMGGGLNKFNYAKKTFKCYKEDPDDPTSISNNWLKTVLESHLGELWVASSNGIDLFNKEKENFTHFIHDTSNSESLSNNHITVIFEDSKNNMWFGTEKGLNRFNRDRLSFTGFDENDGLPDNVIRGVLEDDHGNLWISTNKGLSKFYDAVNYPEEIKFRNYGVDDGLQGESFNTRSCTKGKDGRLYFGGSNGYNVFHPDSIKENPYKPTVVFTDLSIFNKNVKIGAEKSPLNKHINQTDLLVLSYKQSVFAIKYAGLNYLASEKSQYAFMMEGFEEDWNYVGNKQEATYTNLDPGEYIFKVKASNSDGIWNEEPTTLQIIITPPFWETAWFRILAIIIILSSIYILYKYRVRSMEAHRKELEMKVEERTHQLKEKAHDLEVAKSEMDNILNNVEEGFFILDHELKISSQYSAILESIFRDKNVARMDLVEFLKGKIPTDEVENTKNYLELMFNKDIDSTQISDLNPLVDLEFNFKEKSSVIKKYLNINFRRTESKKNQKIELIGTVRDVTQQVLLAIQLKEEEARREKLLQLMLSILDVDPKMLSDFSESANRELTFIDDIMNHNEIEDYHNLLTKVQRSIHLVKGNAKLLNIDYFAEKAHSFEDHVSELLKSKDITEKEIEPLRKRLTEIQNGMVEMETIIEKIGKVLSHKDTTKRTDAGMLLHSLENLINSFSSDLGKKIKFDYKNFKRDIIPERYHLLIKEVLIQLVRNSISHGIETPEERQKLQKPEFGVIEISTFTHNGSVGLKFRDDGRGLQLQKLKQRAIESGKWTAEEVEQWDNSKLADLIFASGITTADKVDMVSGRGVGMDSIKHRLSEYNGQIQVNCQDQKYCEFEILLPNAA